MLATNSVIISVEATSTTSIDRSKLESGSPLKLAVMVWFAAGTTAAGVPVITPVLVLNASPAGSIGEIVKALGVAPVNWGVFGVIGTPAM